MTTELIAIIEGREMGRVARDKTGKLSFTYNEAWRNAPDAFPLSISMPLASSEHGNAKIDPFLWGLLPDNANVLDHWGRRFHVSARNAFGLIANVGEDCAGAVQFVQPERLDAILGQTPPEIEWLDDASVAERLRTLRADHSAWRIPRDTGQFSLAGAQPKTALLFENGRWGVPSGRVPTTHIFKPPTGDLDGHVENEHFCLELARALGLPVVDSRIMRFQDEIAIVVERYDRVRTETGLRRVHQEDICQAFAIPPTRKYQSEGGPGIRDIVELLTANSTSHAEDVATFLDSVAYNWLIVGTDAHAKNYALLIGAEGRIRLAPLYDMASVLPYPDIDIEKVKLSMKLGGEYRLRNITLHHWRKLAAELHVDHHAMTARVDSFAAQLSDHVSEIRRRMAEEGIAHPIVARLAAALVARVAACRKLLQAA
ncbi:MAG TPA: type II toxin-antitoxin system HipA family toxin [Candidatus Acidoferrum sp.]|nr:type II toxin-antitoxin system HipA family toxin [Candidatus Acidoferrum sp.]